MINRVVVRIRPSGISADRRYPFWLEFEGRDQYSQPITVIVMTDIDPGENDIELDVATLNAIAVAAVGPVR